MKQELYRKALHLLLIIVPITFALLGKWKGLIVFTPIAIFVVGLDYLRHKDAKINQIFLKIFGSVLRPHEVDSGKLCGASYVALAICLNFFLFKQEIAITGFLILVISDALAALIGKSIASEAFFEKTKAGSAAFFISGFIILIGCGLAFHMGFWFYFFGLFALICTTILEARPSFLKIDDNFLIPTAFCTIISCFDVMWNYSY